MPLLKTVPPFRRVALIANIQREKAVCVAEVRTLTLRMYQKHGPILSRITRKVMDGLPIVVPEIKIKMFNLPFDIKYYSYYPPENVLNFD